MINLSHEDDVTFSLGASHKSGVLIDANNGATNGFCMGLSFYTTVEFVEFGIHEDQESFFVLEGTGSAIVGNEEFLIKPGDSFIAIAGEKHAIKKNPDCAYVKVLWCHGAN